MSKSITFAVIGAGHGGKAMAADLAIKGFKVRLFNRTHDHIETICARGGIELERPPGTLQFADLELATSDIGDALADADCIVAQTLAGLASAGWRTLPSDSESETGIRIYGLAEAAGIVAPTTGDIQ